MPSTINYPVDEIIELDDQISRLQQRRKALAAELEAVALACDDHQPLNEQDREGRQVILAGLRYRLPVIFESDLVVASFPEGGPVHAAVQAAAGDSTGLLSRLFRPTNTLERVAKDGQVYRRQLRELFEPATAAAILQATLQRDKTGIPKSRTIIATDRAIAV